MLKNAINALAQTIIGLSKDMDVPAGNGDIVYAYQGAATEAAPILSSLWQWPYNTYAEASGVNMRIGLIDVDSHNFPNLALMRISSYHKQRGDIVEWWWSDFIHYDIVYMSKVFSDAYSKDKPEPQNADKVIKGGTGYAITNIDGREVYDKRLDPDLPPEIEQRSPDYSIYPQYDFAISMTSRGCPRGCAFCHVAAKEGRHVQKVADVSDFWKGQSKIYVLDPNITACTDKRDLFHQYIETGAMIDFSQGLDIRLLNDDDISDINQMRLRTLHFAWDNPHEDLAPHFKRFAERFRRKNPGMVYVLTGFDSTLEEDLYRIYKLRELNYDPYVMVYNKPAAACELKQLQRWCNNKIIFKSCPDFKNYRGHVHG